MSHCSTFDIKFRDKHILFKAMRNLNLQPENRVWEQYRTILGKLVLGRLGIEEKSLGVLLTGYCDKINIFFLPQENGELKLSMESHVFSPDQIQLKGQNLAHALQKEYVKSALYQLQKSLIESGQSVRLETEEKSEEIIHTLFIGDQGKKLVVKLHPEGVVSEQVEGYVGKSCADLTAVLENSMTTEAQREWASEQTEVMNNQEVQVLRLNNIDL
ncbi:DUF2997 domain-containing protein [Ethanoligenens harbinense]|uniref:DUF2997 domain-containing protein n=1 Tax=Ethanoligenens harbinense (strain DSM 18485 / JCM 12961 / CGMCC 1.5033 / YUAN-3) TaxID=663278 RepID=E6U3U7_ETHHY|nr:DUF2997 domain-containing protein [Ethanoligenens harbinense]ADU26514.1 hypothetical protein Ethha_0958 [Ethanoligenens harbinense YUAN-3]AVQ95638.1 DUF2997 domain-containing protein [Ethanoligenens harbinense YUAN-3]AYF38302.1 DUF2997 domain-containing protein [Ethanoligenens harbinense]AYF41048.1 DUF2997 domain-containing protein [Ethanoligenens harbinense]QCN91879.1 DUF2997 domain-containing protein [Ethanoligenens harbinense]